MPEALRRNLMLALAGCIALAALSSWLNVGSYGLRLATMAGIYALLAVGYQAVFGKLGALSLAQGAFFGIGAYATALLAARFGLDGAITLPLSAALAVAIAAIVAAPVLRLESHYFALATLGLAQLALLVAVNAESVTGGGNGIPGVPGLALLGFAIPRGWPLLFACWSLVAAAAALAWKAGAGRRGHVLMLVREDPIAAESLGIDTGRLRLAAFLFAAGCAGIAGALHAHLLGIVSPEVLEFPVMVACLSMVVIGGRGRIAGAVLGAVLLVHLPEFLRGIGPWYLAAYGALLLAMIVFAPEGIAGLIVRFAAQDQGPAPEPLPSRPAPAAPQPAAGPTAGTILSLRAVTRRFGGVVAIDGIDLAIAAGELVGVIGPNGSGKTTLVNVVAGLYPPDSGQVIFDGGDVAGLAPFRIARQGIGRGFQTPRLLETLNVAENVALAATASAPAAEVRALLDRFRLGAVAGLTVGALPGGVRRRVEIARAMAAQPRLLLLDEPAAGLTPAEQDELRAMLTGLNREGVAIVVIEHSVAFLSRLAPRLVCLVGGRVVADGTPEAVIRDPTVVAAYLGRPVGAGR